MTSSNCPIPKHHDTSSSNFALRMLATVVILFVGAAPTLADAGRWKREGWKTDFSKSTIKFSEIFSGGPPKDGIPSIDKPQFKPISEISNITDAEPVVGLVIAGDARAYPLQVLIWHEIVNDTVGGKPVTVTYCPLCNSAIVFDRHLNGQTLDFGTTGKLRKSDLVMYDRATESWWQQFTGDAIVGEMVGKSLTMLPARLESYAQFKSRHPNGRVLVPNNPNMRQYGHNPYVGYDRAAKPFLYSGSMPEGINPMARVIAVRNDNTTFAVAMSLLRKMQAITVSGVTLQWQPGQVSAIDAGEIAKSRDIGTVTASQPDGKGGQQSVPYDVTFAFVVHAFHPNIKIRTQ